MRYLIPISVLLLLKLASGSSLYGDVLIGDFCFGGDEDCKGDPGVTSYCDPATTTCECMPQYVASKSKEDCLKVANIGEQCVEPQQCQAGSGLELSDCYPNEEDEGESVCKCTDDAIEVETGTPESPVKICEKKATFIGDVCHVDEQCTALLGNLTTCDGQFCICKPEFVAHPDNNRCLPSGIHIGQRCEATVQCVGDPGSRCASGICACVSDYTASNSWDDCLPIRNNENEPCEEIQQCQQGALQQHSNCTGTDPSNMKCMCTPNAVSISPGEPCRLKATVVGDPCVREAQCLNLGESTCFGGICTCKSDAVESTDKTKCLSKSLLREECVDENQCKWIEGALCTSKNASDPSAVKDCRCGPDFATPEWVTDVCHPKAQFIGRPCDKHPIQCVDLEGSQCLVDGKICACHELTQVVSGDSKRCLQKVTGLNSTCEETPQCSQDNSECLLVNVEEGKKECKCKRNEYVEGWNPNGTCLEVIHEVRRECKENHQCTTGLGSRSECADGFCQCKIGSSYYDGRCYLPAQLGERCNTDGECKAGVNSLAHCDNSVCQCVANATDFEEKCYMQKVLGDSCDNDKECSVFIGGAVNCDRGTNKCSCLMGYVPEFENKICVSGALRLETQFGMILVSIIFAFAQKLF